MTQTRIDYYPHVIISVNQHIFFGRFKDLTSHPNRVIRYGLRDTRITPNVPITLIITRPIQSYFKQTFRLILTDLLQLRNKHSSRAVKTITG